MLPQQGSRASKALMTNWLFSLPHPHILPVSLALLSGAPLAPRGLEPLPNCWSAPPAGTGFPLPRMPCPPLFFWLSSGTTSSRKPSLWLPPVWLNALCVLLHLQQLLPALSVLCVFPPADGEDPGGQGTNCTTVKAGELLLQSLIRGGGTRTMPTGLLPALPSSVCSRILPLLLFLSLLALKEEFCFGFLGSCDVESKRDGDGRGCGPHAPFTISEKRKERPDLFCNRVFGPRLGFFDYESTETRSYGHEFYKHLRIFGSFTD